jgi:hypothetical protein
MSAAIRNDPNKNGLTINNSQYLLSQYTDDSSLILDDDEVSLERALYILKKNSECVGLRANLDNTEAIYIGSNVNLRDKLLPEQNLNWTHTGKSKLL